MYGLEKRLLSGGSQPVWKRYAVCGSLFLLERVRTAQRHPEDWRIIRISDLSSDGFPKAS